MNLGAQIRSLRIKNKMTQKELSQNLDISQSTVAAWEANKRRPTTEMINKISSFFNVSNDYLLENKDDPLIEFNGLFRKTIKDNNLSSSEQNDLRDDLAKFLQDQAEHFKGDDKK